MYNDIASFEQLSTGLEIVDLGLNSTLFNSSVTKPINVLASMMYLNNKAPFPFEHLNIVNV